jgi:uncharacterized membrane protein YgdD (TMEM256/DUF423 family)
MSSPAPSAAPPDDLPGSRWVACGALLAFLAVAGGAFGAHALKQRLTPEELAIYEIGVRYHLAHALALVLVGALSRGGRRLAAAGWCFTAGIAGFSGSLYALALTGWKGLGAITPLGGVAFLCGWLLLAAKFSFRGSAPTRE